jgi:hypothetical protein
VCVGGGGRGGLIVVSGCGCTIITLTPPTYSPVVKGKSRSAQVMTYH